MIKKLSLANAIREGAKLRPQGRGHFFVYNESGALCSCAMGGIFDVLTKQNPQIDSVEAVLEDTEARLLSWREDEDCEQIDPIEVCENADDDFDQTIMREYPELHSIPDPAKWPKGLSKHLDTLFAPHTLAVCITKLNDELMWTREQIADWVETL